MRSTILIAPTSFKGTIGAAAAARAMAAGALRAASRRRVVELPLSDGGPGLIDALLAISRGDVREVEITGPLGHAVTGRILIWNRMAVVESADACGMERMPAGARDPLRATTYGVGELVRAAALHAATVVVGLGGSATVDGGAGMGQALGWRLLDITDQPIARGGAGLSNLNRILPPSDAPTANARVIALADVRNPLLGPDGAAAVFGPQKGARPPDVQALEEGLGILAHCIARDLGLEVALRAGAGAAGGLGAGCFAFLGAELLSGSEWVLSAVGFDRLLEEAAVLVTGEGAYDGQTGMGKVVGEVIARARGADVPVLLVAGRVDAPPPQGVIAATGAGAELHTRELEALVAMEVGRLLEG